LATERNSPARAVLAADEQATLRSQELRLVAIAQARIGPAAREKESSGSDKRHS
jgi:hypothetical protein